MQGKRRGGGPNGPAMKIPTTFAVSERIKTPAGKLAMPKNGILTLSNPMGVAVGVQSGKSGT